MPDDKSPLMRAMEKIKEEAGGERGGALEKVREISAWPGKPETTDAPREKMEPAAESGDDRETKGGGEGAPAPAGGIIAASRQAQRMRERQKKIEALLEADLRDIYLKMDPEKRKEFRAAGERTAREINGLLEETKIRMKKIIALIKNWLALIPGVNKFFLEQEAKIKADEIMKIKRNYEI